MTVSHRPVGELGVAYPSLGGCTQSGTAQKKEGKTAVRGLKKSTELKIGVKNKKEKELSSIEGGGGVSGEVKTGTLRKNEYS